MSLGGLAKRKCEVCAPGTPTIGFEQAQELQTELDTHWSRYEIIHLKRAFKLRNFRDAFGFATRVALLAEEQGHHPDLEIGWGYVNITLTTHAAKGLTENDFIMAAKIDKIAQHDPLKES